MKDGVFYSFDKGILSKRSEGKTSRVKALTLPQALNKK